MSGERVRARIVVGGRVQGVAFRAHAVEAAERCGVSGWVRNLPDGRVEAVAEGTRDAVDRFVAWCRRGPRMAHVDGVEVAFERHRGEFAGFDIRYG